jgi:phage shock protein PspC (stress-responsive transcriptional regulator)
MAAQVAEGSRLVRPRDGRWIGGVCAGIADRFGMERRTVRLLFVMSTLIPGPQFVVYLALWLLIPSDG